MRVRIVSRIAIVVFTMAAALGPAMAGEHGVAPTSNPGGNNYYLAPRLAATPVFEYVYAACQEQGLSYGDAIALDGHAYPCP
jgi:hypothetical protein